jgi:hypothetical protein
MSVGEPTYLPCDETFWPRSASHQNCCAVANFPNYKNFGLVFEPLGEPPPQQLG